MRVMLPSYFIAASAAIILLLGLVHLLYTFVGTRLEPRDAALKPRMQEVPPMISRETSMWRAWVGFNASHSFGALLFGALYLYLPLMHPELFFKSWFLLGTGMLLLVGYVVLARAYWFSVPFHAIVVAACAYGLGLVVQFASRLE